jgi:hypothetical protein
MKAPKSCGWRASIPRRICSKRTLLKSTILEMSPARKVCFHHQAAQALILCSHLVKWIGRGSRG